MSELSDFFIQTISSGETPLALGLLAAAAALEYIFPPFPGDTITLFGAVLVTAYDWSFWAVLAAVMAGSVLGSLLAFFLGLRLAGRTADSPRLQRVIEGFERHGALYLSVNRFLPGLRAFFFVAAGMARLSVWAVAFYSALSALLWNLALLALGATLGANFEELKEWLGTYLWFLWIALAAAALATWLWRRRTRNI